MELGTVLITLLACLVSLYWWKAVWRALAQGARQQQGGLGADASAGAVIGRTKAALKLPPGSLGVPWVGESMSFLAAVRAGDPDRFLRDRTARFGSQTFKTVIFNQKTVVMQGAAANRFIGACENKGLLRNAWPPSMLSVVGRGAPVVMHGAEHRRLRYILLSCLSPLALHNLVARAHTLTLRHFATCWTQLQEQGAAQAHLVPLLNLHTFRLACSLLAHVTDEHLLARLHPHFNAWRAGMLDLPLNFPGTSYRRARLAGNLLRHQMGCIIDRRLEALKSGCSAADINHVDQEEAEDVLSMLLKAQDQSRGFLSRHETQDVLLFLLFAGHDTTTAALTFALKYLEQNPAWLDLVVQEQEAIAGQKKAGERLNWGDVQKMRYTWRVIQETMRLRPPITASMKEAMVDLVFEGYDIPKGWKVYLSIGRTHCDEKYFSSASTFDPSRFDHELQNMEGDGPPPFAYVPFGVGPHSCPGNVFARMTMCVYMHVLVCHFKWASLNPDEKVSIFTFPTLMQGYPATIIQKKLPVLLS
ncbi:hypothetical protein GOP47_0026197 [Adiantum capillus-veneris]|nr:hypothetical protein GOP47_0026197 [Adiantum capillus-veneris]